VPGGKIDILVEPDLKGFPAKLGSGLRAASGVASAAGKAIGVALVAGSVAAAAGFKEILNLGIDYQNSMNTLQAVTGATAEQMQQVGARAQELGSDLTLPATSAVDAATAMTELAKGGLSVEQAMTAAKGTLQLAAAAQIDAGTAAQIQANALNTFNLSADKAGMVADVLAGAANAATGEITDFASAFQSGGSVAAQFGLSIGDTATALALFANNGIQGSDAGTLLKASLLALTDQGKPAQKAMKQLGLDVYDAKGRFVGFPQLMDQLAAAAKRMTPEQYQAATATLFGSDAVRFAGIAAKTTSAQWQELSAQVTKAGSAQEIAAAKAKGVGGAFDAIQSQMETIGLQIFNVIAQPLEDGLRVIAQFLDQASTELSNFIGSGGLQQAFDNAVTGIQAFGDRIGITWDGVVAFFTDGVAKIQEVVGNIAAFLAPVGAGLVAVFDSFRQSGGVFDIAATAIGYLVDGFVALTGVLRPIGEVIGTVLGLFAALPAPIQTFVLAMAAFKGLPLLADAFDTSIGKLLTTSGPLGTVLGAAIDGVIGGFGRVGDAAKNSVGGVKQFIDEMRLQKALAAQSGESISNLEAAQAAYETTTIGSIASIRELIDSFTEIKAGADAAGEPVSDFEAAIRALGEQGGTIGDLVASFDAGAAAGRAFGDRIQASATAAATALSDRLVGATEAAGRAIANIPATLAGVGGAIADAFGAGVEFIQDIPGRVAAVGESISSGLGDAFGAAADFVGEFGDQITQALSGINFGSIRAGLAGFVSSVRSGFSSAVAAVRSFGTQIAGAVTGAVTAFAGLGTRVTAAVSSIRAAFTGLSFASIAAGFRTGVAAIGTAVTSGLAAARAGIAAFGTSVQNGLIGAFRAIPGLISGATGALTGFASRVAGIGATIGTGLLKGIGGLINILGGPLGVALLAAQFGLQALAKSQANAAQAAQEHQSRLDALAGTLETYSAAVTQATVDEKANQLAKDGTLTKVKELGVSTRDYTLASLGNGDALARVKDQMAAHTRGLIANSDTYKGWKTQLDAAGITLDDLTAAASGSQPALDKVNGTLRKLESAAGARPLTGAVAGLLQAGEASRKLADELGISNGELQKIQDQMRLAEEASGNFERQLGFLKQGFGGLKDGGVATAEFAKGLSGLAVSARDAASAAGESAAKINGVKAGADAAAASMQKSRDAFIESATAAGLTAEQAGALADSVGLIPSAARIIFETNATGVSAELITIGEQIKAVPDAKSVTVNTLSEEAAAKLRSFGIQVETLPNGQSRIVLEDAEARARFLAFQALISTSTGRMLLDLEPSQALAALQGVVAQAGGTTAIMKLDGEPSLVNGKIQQAVVFADGSRGVIQLDGNADPVTGKITATVTFGNGQTATIQLNPRDLVTPAINRIPKTGETVWTIRYVTTGAGVNFSGSASGTVGGAIGGIVKGMDAGGVLGMANGGRVGVKLTPMRGGIGQIVPPNTWRVIGDRIKDDEAYIPINRSNRSRRIFEETARRMGYQVARQYADGGFADRLRAVTAAAASRGTVNVGPIADQIATLRQQLTAARREVAITNQFFTEPSARDSDTVARAQRRQASLGLFA
jgi:TP901 family phage tail tape measure protein